jgi:hypothetical protein
MKSATGINAFGSDFRGRARQRIAFNQLQVLLRDQHLGQMVIPRARAAGLAAAELAFQRLHAADASLDDKEDVQLAALQQGRGYTLEGFAHPGIRDRDIEVFANFDDYLERGLVILRLDRRAPWPSATRRSRR